MSTTLMQQRLCAASQLDDVSAVRSLLDRNADHNNGREDDTWGTTPLIIASIKGCRAVMALLLERNADPSKGRANDGSTALHISSQSCNLGIVQLLLEGGANPDAATTDDGSTALYVASQYGHLEVMQLLLDHNADPNKVRTGNGPTALYMTSYEGHAEAACLLLDHGAALHMRHSEDGSTALQAASRHGHTQVVRLLLGRGGDANTATIKGTTALFEASTSGHLDVARLLLDHGACPNTATASGGATALHAASEHDHVEVVSLLLRRAADPNAATDAPNGLPPLFIAAKQGHLRVVQLLAVYGAARSTLFQIGSISCTAQQAAGCLGHSQLAAWLGVTNNQPPIHIAVGWRMHAEAQSALRIGAMSDPTVCTLQDVMHTATSSWLQGTQFVHPASPHVKLRYASHNVLPPTCKATVQLARAAMACWSPERHWLFHPNFRAAVHTVMLVRNRIEAANQATAALDPVFPEAPLEIWFLVCARLLRRHWECAH